MAAPPYRVCWPNTRRTAAIAAAGAPVASILRLIRSIVGVLLVIVSLAATVLGLVEQIEQPACIRAREGIQTVGLSLFDCIVRRHPFGAKLRRLFLHQKLPPHWVEFPHEHVNAHFGDPLDVRRSFLPQITL